MSASTNDGRARNWVFILYPESAPTNWAELLDGLHVPAVVSPLHDKDVNPDGEPKKPHHHILLLFPGKKSYEQVKVISQDLLNGTIPQECKNARGQVRYFLHMDNPEKVQYSASDMRSFGGADCSEYLKITNICRHEMLRKMRKYIRDNNIYSFAQFLDFCDDEHTEWSDLLDDNSTMVISNYIKSRIYDRRDTMAQELAEAHDNLIRLQQAVNDMRNVDNHLAHNDPF